MVELEEKDTRNFPMQSSKGNQLKWEQAGIWYKADYMGYEGLAEYMVSSLLRYSNLQEEDIILYETEEIAYRKKRYLGCRSENFLPDGWQLITLERLFHSFYNRSLYKSLFEIQNIDERSRFLVEQVELMTGLTDFGVYLSKLLTVDALFLNEDRHMHNIAVMREPDGKYHYCPIFDNGCALLSDTMMDYPLDTDIIELIPQVQAKTLSQDFDEQLEAVEKLYGQHIIFYYDQHVITELLEKEEYYSLEIKKRVRDILYQQKRAYSYLFK